MVSLYTLDQFCTALVISSKVETTVSPISSIDSAASSEFSTISFTESSTKPLKSSIVVPADSKTSSILASQVLKALSKSYNNPPLSGCPIASLKALWNSSMVS